MVEEFPNATQSIWIRSLQPRTYPPVSRRASKALLSDLCSPNNYSVFWDRLRRMNYTTVSCSNIFPPHCRAHQLLHQLPHQQPRPLLQPLPPRPLPPPPRAPGQGSQTLVPMLAQESVLLPQPWLWLHNTSRGQAPTDASPKRMWTNSWVVRVCFPLAPTLALPGNGSYPYTRRRKGTRILTTTSL